MPENYTRQPDLWSSLTTPGWCLDKCVAKNFTVAGVHGALCRCGNSSPTFARVHLSQCSWKCEVDRNQTCGGPEHLSVVGPGYPSVPAYCAHEETLKHQSEFEDPRTQTQKCRAHSGGCLGWCIEKCASSGNYRYAGLKGGGCYCGARHPAREWVVEDSRCSYSSYSRCSYSDGVPHHSCGGEGVISVYQLNTTTDTEDIAPEEEEEDDPLFLTTSSSSDASQTTTGSAVGKDLLLFFLKLFTNNVKQRI